MSWGQDVDAEAVRVRDMPRSEAGAGSAQVRVAPSHFEEALRALVQVCLRAGKAGQACLSSRGAFRKEATQEEQREYTKESKPALV